MSGWSGQTLIPMSLRYLFPRSSFVGCADIRVTEATERSSECVANVLFAAMPGTRVDGIGFVNEAVDRGATSLLVENPLANVSVPQCVVPNVRRAYAELCAALAGYPAHRLRVAGVTGTNGKTTVTWLIRAILQAAHKKTGLLGTVEYSDGFHSQQSRLTTPDSKTLSSWLAAMVARRTTHAAIELSSHALHQDRCARRTLDVAIVTNVTQDHFDYHDGYDSYLTAKARIVEHCKQGGLVVLNADDPGSSSLRNQAEKKLKVLTYGLETVADVSAEILSSSLTGSRFVLNLNGQSIEVSSMLVGRHNVSNCLAAAAAVRHFGVSLDEIAAGIESLISVPGRLERVDCGQAFDVFVDYAHTEDALKRSVDFLRTLTRGRVICVFGAGGDRDRSKRPLLARAAAEADLVVVTSDNPRMENPQRIIDEILTGFPASVRQPHVEVDRADAIRWALEQARTEDCVLVAGKGHETAQIIGTKRIPFDDRRIIREALFSLMNPPQKDPARMPA